MKKFSFLFLFVSFFTFSQKIEYLEKKDSLHTSENEFFTFLDEKTNSDSAQFLAKIKSTGKTDMVTNLYEVIKTEAQRIGANSFKFIDYSKIDNENSQLTFDIFRVDDDVLQENFNNLEKNKVYVFGSDDLIKSKKISFKIDNNKYEIGSGEFMEFQSTIGKELKISKGGITGMTIWIKSKEDKPSSFLNFSGFGLVGAEFNPYSNGVGVGFTTGRINKFDPNLGFILTKIFKRLN